MTHTNNNPFRESAAYFKHIAWSFVVGVLLLVITGFALYAAGPSTSLRPTLIDQKVASDTMTVEAVVVGMPALSR